MLLDPLKAGNDKTQAAKFKQKNKSQNQGILNLGFCDLFGFCRLYFAF
jgi:hypothetical protein